VSINEVPIVLSTCEENNVKGNIYKILTKYILTCNLNPTLKSNTDKI